MHQNDDRLKKRAFSSAIWKFAERFCAQGVSLVVSILLARMLVPEDYSVVGIVAIFFAFCNVFVSNGMNAALIQKKDTTVEDYSTVLYLNLSIAFVLYAVMFFCAPLIAELYEKGALTLILRVMSLTFFANALKSVLSAYVSNNLEFKQFFRSTIIGTVVSAVVGVAMAYKGMGPWALVAQEMTNTVIDTLILYLSTRMKFVKTFSFARIRSMVSYGWKIMISGVISVLYDNLSPLIVGLKFTTADLAYYNKGGSFPGLINSTVSDTLASVLFPVMSKMQDDCTDVLNVTRRFVKVASFVIFPMMIGMAAVADSFVSFLLTDKWLPAAVYIRIFCISHMFNLVQVGNLQAIKAIGRSDITLRLEVIKKSIYFVLIYLFVLLSDKPEVFALSSIFCTVVAFVVNTYPNRKLLGYWYRYQFADILPNLAISLLMGVLVMLTGRLPLSAGVLLPLQILTGVAAYVGLSVVTRNENFRYLLDFLMQMRRGDDNNDDKH